MWVEIEVTVTEVNEAVEKVSSSQHRFTPRGQTKVDTQ